MLSKIIVDSWLWKKMYMALKKDVDDTDGLGHCPFPFGGAVKTAPTKQDL